MINISQVLPHAKPFILPDLVVSIDLEHGQIHTRKRIEVDDYFLNGHFEHEPIFPGVMLIETMAQSAGILLSQLKQESKTMFLAKVADVRFRTLVRPGDLLEVFVQLQKEKGRICVFTSEIQKDGEVITTSEFTLAVGDM